jgi:uncharacterized protein
MIASLTEDEFAAELDKHIRPSRPIDSYEHLFGRERSLSEIKQALSSSGRHVFIYGDRGVGKTSLARTAAFTLHPTTSGDPIYVACGENTSFSSLIEDVVSIGLGRSALAETRRETTVSVGTEKLFGTSAKNTTSERAKKLDSANAAVAGLAEVVSHRGGRCVVVIDEFENLAADSDRKLFAELIKQISDRNTPIGLIFCGIGRSLDKLLAGHSSSHRYLEEIKLERLSFSGRWEIIDKAAEALGVSINPDSRFRLAAISDGFPHFVHLVAHKLFWETFSDADEIQEISPEIYVRAVKSALKSTEAHLRNAYDLATMKYDDAYQEVLWALADHYELYRNAKKVYDTSYQRIAAIHPEDALTYDQFKSRINNLKSERHGKILFSDRPNWFSFSESIIRGYVRLRAESSGVKLAIEHDE